MGIIATVILVVLTIFGSIEAIGVTYTHFKRKYDEDINNTSVSFEPKKDKDRLWGEYSTWLEIVSKEFSLDKCVAVLTKLEYEGVDGTVNCLHKISNDLTPKLKLSNPFIRKGVSEKIFIAKTKKLTELLILFDSEFSEPLPKSNQFYFQVFLIGTKGKATEIKAPFKGNINYDYFGTGNNVLEIEPIQVDFLHAEIGSCVKYIVTIKNHFNLSLYPSLNHPLEPTASQKWPI